MQEKFETIFKEAENDKVKLIVTPVGNRPCAKSVASEALEALKNTCRGVIEKYIGKSLQSVSASTDCNAPMSLGIPSVAVGVYNGDGCHTREEWIEIESLKSGLKIAIELIEAYL